MRYLKLILILMIICIIPGCTVAQNPEYISLKTKPNTHFYTGEIYSKLSKDEPYTLKIFDMNVYKYFNVNTREHSIVLEFIENLKDPNFNIEIDSKLEPRYKLIIEFEDSKYVINAYNEKELSVYPWDGTFPEDTISMEDVPDYYNIYKFCEFITKISQGYEG
ncbi:DUF4883 family protein [Clostridium gasigenes]|uniref:DUF4883 family protein n=1 Tax=Clostridium gasigenes TaxID=94869 RepID=UPI0014384ED8|nr:DUF4883 family protein [Clostridium gasigenes]MBB6622206.1 DUF4883 family protein [Clostridium gasigenes]MBU3087028.1 DUF4883 family protein [Clostridium gasigenes]MBU3131154.1 DUF4883 family protein [Clostridium gasigenes]MBU3134675.1 DUF4883 family protein [Clostridium gasigenes]NKF08621.1 DUF4883 family protein [Clostridium gasigenes]